MKYKAIIFDMDGTILDTEHIWKKATYALIEKRGIIITHEIKQELEHKLAGNALRESCTIIKQTFNFDDSIETLMQEKLATSSDLFGKQVRFMDGFLAFYQKVKVLNIKIALATNAQQESVAIADQKLNLQQYFGEHIYSISHVNNISKPDPAIYLHAADKIEEDPKQCIAIEDSARGIQAAQNAGMLCIGFNAANLPQQVQHADVIVNAFHEIDLGVLMEK